jgi:dienelactone hydrolase
MKRSSMVHSTHPWSHEIRISAGGVQLDGTLSIPSHALGLVLFAHGSGSSRNSPRNRRVAQALQQAGLGTLLFDLLTEEEERIDEETAELRFDIDFLAGRLQMATRWIEQNEKATGLRIGYFGSSTGAAAALVAAASEHADIAAIVSRGGRPDLAKGAQSRVRAPTLLIVGGEDIPVIAMNQDACARLHCEKHLEIIPGATHLFQEPGTLDRVADLAAHWFIEHLPAKDWHS